MSPTKSTLLKVIAWFLAVATGLSAIVGIGANIYAMETDMYTSDTSYYDTDWFQSIASGYRYRIIDAYEFSYVSNYLGRANNLGYVLEDMDGTILSQKTLEGEIGTTLVMDDFLHYKTNALTYETMELEEPIPVVVTLHVAANMDLSDDFAPSYMTYNLIEQNLDILPTFTIASILICLFSIIFSVVAVGHQKGTDEIVLNIQDKIPFDLYLCIAVAILIIPLFGVLYVCDSGLRPTTICAVVVVYGLYGLSVLLACLLTFATRLKVGKWWRNTLFYGIGSWALDLAGKTLSALPAVLMVCVFWGICSLAFLSSTYSFGIIFFLCLFLGIFFLSLAIQMDILRKAGKQLAEGKLEDNINTKWLFPPCKKHLSHLMDISNAITKAVDARMKSEHMKTELITNVSHDIKTPLTSIINYVDLLKKEDLPEKSQEYLDIVDRHANRLKKLTTDLVEISKASTGNTPCDLQPTDISELMYQATTEYTEKWQNANLYPILDIPETEVLCMIDGTLTWRVLNNILGNTTKYAQSGTRVYVEVETTKEHAILSIKNISKESLNIAPDELMERFVRGDASRSTEGSGLGLHIAKSLVELQHGDFSIDIDGDLFKTVIVLPLAK
ncbi:HAMP domain-containing sensor histidine kinase [Chakrabartyella piscis]|uniref:sensor histidine kinase n=1 Tax=Chakrabartyella piscis TaxID=2918914 RepID=UPI0029588193|nr:HAMP domain-containing sensor histidine kinase [Chakrabartyella piscis]